MLRSGKLSAAVLALILRLDDRVFSGYYRVGQKRRFARATILVVRGKVWLGRMCKFCSSKMFSSTL
jgi:hypothetical protein